MKPPICPVCYRNCDGEYIKFVDYQQMGEGFVGHPAGCECFCKEHDNIARRFSHLPSSKAIAKITFHGLLSATIYLLLSIGSFIFLIIGLSLTFKELKKRGDELQFEDLSVFLVFILIGIPITGLFGYFSYRNFKPFRPKSRN